MQRGGLDDLDSFLAVARECSFTRAAAKLGVSQSALSHTVRGLEARLGVRLLARTTRSVSPTEAGERLLRNVGPHLEEIAAELRILGEMHDRPVGTLRINASEHAASTLLWPRLKDFLARYPEIRLELALDEGLVDIVAGGFDAGVRLGEQVAPGMIAARIGPDQRMIVVGSHAYFSKHLPPKAPADLVRHRCIAMRLPTYGGLYAWEFEKGGRELKVRVEGQIVFNRLGPQLDAARAGFGLACVPEDAVREDLARGCLKQVLDDWCPPFPGYHLYYPSRRQHSRAFVLLLEALRYRP